MYSISEVAIKTGFTAHTLRYYEKIGLLSSPLRKGGKRRYTEGEIRLLKFMKMLKQTGMSLEDIQEFLKDGCLLENIDSNDIQLKKIQTRIDILKKHLLLLEEQKQEIETVMNVAKVKLETYETMIGGLQDEE
ncbi:MerR family transcriptional regulator [Bacillus pseudomycoides]|uniref:MerR family transcriptional regulator n=1 Tax=Bacillus TaxID=1386 RepID=UPI000BEC530E|nr:MULTISPECIES: MerR family transcriptional regulator [Bacillus]MCX2829220.1 MerR family transcriptional regulator [Bacillus sp. DHT2]MDR4918688.1 MerR family transcriptional regulator [Bacillus pseudomycoides]PEF73755.1 MerR family transcriptional regulator [Bacillus pseudomycoides]PEL80642.1 MerR family transcriptional regulator [Bacillus pseudomycoides]